MDSVSGLASQYSDLERLVRTQDESIRALTKSVAAARQEAEAAAQDSSRLRANFAEALKGNPTLTSSYYDWYAKKQITVNGTNLGMTPGEFRVIVYEAGSSTPTPGHLVKGRRSSPLTVDQRDIVSWDETAIVFKMSESFLALYEGLNRSLKERYAAAAAAGESTDQYPSLSFAFSVRTSDGRVSEFPKYLFAADRFDHG